MEIPLAEKVSFGKDFRVTTLLEQLRIPITREQTRESRYSIEIPVLPPAVPFGGLSLRPLTPNELIEALTLRAKCRVRTTVHYLNAHVFDLARQNGELRDLLSDCDLLYADGASIVLASRLLGYTMPGRLTAADYFVEFCSACADQGLRPYLVGGAAGVAETAADRLVRAVPGLEFAGTSHGYLSGRESIELAHRIDRSEADILIVGMSSPAQELWIRDYGSRTDVPVLWSVGALLDYFAGVERRAPQWLCRCHGEWLYRLAMNPGQRWRRYVFGNARFAGWLARELLCPGRAGWSPAASGNAERSLP